jgi:hypothetical protein
MIPGLRLSGLGRLKGYRGLGQDDSTTVLNPTFDTSNIPITNPPGGYPVAAPAQSSGFNWGATIGNLLNQWTGIASNVIAPRNTIQTGPQGTSINVAAGSQLPTGALLTPSLAGGSGTLFWIVGGGLGLVLLFSLLGGGHRR